MRATVFGIFLIFFGTSSAKLMCHQCSGINCQRSNYNRTETCVNDMDVCVTIFDGSAVKAQGCMQNMAEDLRKKCMGNNGRMPKPDTSQQCHMCLSNFCNDMGPRDYECIQCDSEKDEKCRNNPAAFMPKQCPISRAMNAYCYVNSDGNRIVRGCAEMVEQQKDCLSRNNCLLCSPMDFKACNVAQIGKDEGNGGNGGNDGGNGGNDGGNGGNDGGNGGNGGNDGGNGGNDGGNGGNDGGNGGNDGGNGGNDGGNGGNDGGNNQSPKIVFNIKTLLIAIALGMRFA